MSEAFLKIVNMSISASWLVLAVLLLRLVLKKAPKWASVLLWGIVAVRLICPVSIESVLSLIPSAETVSPEIMMDWTPEVSTGIPAVDTVVNPVITETFAPQPIASANPLQILIPVSANLWLLGILVMLGYTAVSYLLLRHRVTTAVRLRDNIYQSENVDSPFVLGMIRPKIYLPFRMDSGNLGHVIAHEQAHIRRKDHWWKPFGFVLLAIHWFNPLMWVGYLLLCRDIELACDEKVIGGMDSNTKADYTQALVACSVNRRRIAACPLAFGEVGVKERVKNVMNYKKPAFWIVIAAVALCIVVAVCFLTDPLKTNKDFDAKMLEFPGLKWGMTVEEAKSALHITDDMIIEEKAYDGEWRLTVSGSEQFGVDAENVILRFCQYDDRTELWSVQVTYPTGTDMTTVRDNLAEVYGPGTDYGFTNYELHNDTVQSYIDWNHTNSIQFGSSIEANAKNPKPKDEINHRWASNIGSEVFTEEEIERFVRLFGDDVGTYADRETVLEYLEKTVKVTIRCRDGYTMNNSLEFRPAVTFTGRYVSFNKAAYDAENPTEETTAKPTMSNDLPMLCYPDIAWGATPEQVKDILGVTEEQIILEDPLIDEYTLLVKDISFLGNEVLSAQFNFHAQNGQYHFKDVQLYFPAETDMTVVKDDLTAFYGAPKDEPGITRYKVTNIGSVETYTDYVANRLFFLGDTPVEGWWESKVSLADSVAKEIQDKLVYRAVILNKGDEDFGEAVREYLEKEPATFICCTNGNHLPENDNPYYTKNVVILSAVKYIEVTTD